MGPAQATDVAAGVILANARPSSCKLAVPQELTCPLRRAGYAGLIGSLLFAAAAAEPAEKSGGRRASALLLKPADYRHYVDRLPDADTAWPWLAENVPLFECSDRALEEIYYFRWYTFHRHIKPTPDGYVITEFQPDVRWAGKQNTISCAAGHHFYEGRWLRDRRYLRDYALFWFRKGGEPRRYSFWAADAIRAWSMVTHDLQLAVDLYPDLAANYAEWERTHLDANGLFWQIDDRDGMEYSHRRQRLPSHHQQLYVRRRRSAGRDRAVGEEAGRVVCLPHESRGPARARRRPAVGSHGGLLQDAAAWRRPFPGGRARAGRIRAVVLRAAASGPRGGVETTPRSGRLRGALRAGHGRAAPPALSFRQSS